MTIKPVLLWVHIYLAHLLAASLFIVSLYENKLTWFLASLLLMFWSGFVHYGIYLASTNLKKTGLTK